MTAPSRARAGEPFTLKADLLDSRFEPFEGATVTFHARVNFFAEDWIEIGRAVTDDDGTATDEVTLKVFGDLEVAVRYGEVESVQTIQVAEADEPLYRPTVGLHLPHFTEDVAFGPEAAFELGEKRRAPTTAFRFPGSSPGILLFAYVAAMLLVWGLYLRIMYQLLRIPMAVRREDTDTTLIPVIGLVVMGALLLLLTFILLTGPQSHFHLLH